MFRAGRFDTLNAQWLCLAGAYQCSVAATKALWQRELHWSDDDQKALEAWRIEFDRLQDVSRALDAADAPIPLVGDLQWSLQQRLVYALISATNERELESSITTLLGAHAVAGWVAPLHSIRPRFDAWWQKQGAALASAFAKQLAEVTKKKNLTVLAEQVLHFYNPPLTGPQRVTFHLIPRLQTPDDRHGTHTSATVIDTAADVEFLPTEAASDRVDVVLHELFHFFFSARSLEQHLALVKAFSASSQPEAMGLYTLLDEGLATAFGNGLVAQRVTPPAEFALALATPGRFYASDDIDAVGKRWFGGAARWLEHHATLGPELAPELLTLAAPGVTQLRQRLNFVMHTRAFEFVNDDDRPVVEWLTKELRGSSTFSDSGSDSFTLERYPQVSGVVLVRTTELGRLPKEHPSLFDDRVFTALKSRPAGVYGVARSPQADVYVIIAPDRAGLEVQARRLVSHDLRFTQWLDDTPAPAVP